VPERVPFPAGPPLQVQQPELVIVQFQDTT
jgi:hypothetical protein